MTQSDPFWAQFSPDPFQIAKAYAQATEPVPWATGSTNMRFGGALAEIVMSDIVFTLPEWHNTTALSKDFDFVRYDGKLTVDLKSSLYPGLPEPFYKARVRHRRSYQHCDRYVWIYVQTDNTRSFVENLFAIGWLDYQNFWDIAWHDAPFNCWCVYYSDLMPWEAWT